MQAAAELGYQLPERAPGNRDLSTIGVLVKRHPNQGIPIDPFYGAVFSGAEQLCQLHGINLMYASVDVDLFSQLVEWPPLVRETQIEGWLILGVGLSRCGDELETIFGTNVVLVDAYPSTQLFDNIITDNQHGVLLAMNYLIKQGHHHIGLIGSTPESYPSVAERRAAYFEALKRAGIEHNYVEDATLHAPEAYEATRRMLVNEPQVTAIFACNDDTAMGVLRAAHELGRRVPDDLSVVGFDDLELASETIPPLTTVQVDKSLMGALAVRQLIDRRQNPNRVPLTIRLGTRLVVRQSVRALTG